MLKLITKTNLQPGLWRRFHSDQRGIIIIMFALMLPIIVAFIGLGVEVTYWFAASRDLQAAADAAALAGSYELAEGRSSSVGSVATTEAGSNGWESTGGTITIRSFDFNATYPATGNYTADQDAVEVVLTQDQNLMFAGYFMSSDITITARAVGLAVAGSSEACILALGASNQADALKVQGASTNVTMSGCAAASNSTSSASVDVTSNFTVDCVYSAGGIDGSANTTACASPGKTNQPTVADPYETAVTKPANSAFDDCDSAGDTSSSDGSNYKAPPSSDYDLDPGVYCDIDFGVNGVTLTLSAGTYYIDQGDFSVGSGGIIDGAAGVTIVFGDSTGSNDCGGLSVGGASYINMTAPITEDGEPYTGLVFYRSSDCDAAEDFSFTGTTTSTILGAVYNPSGDISITGTGAVDGTCLQLIADSVTFGGDSDIGSTCDDVDVQTITAGGVGSLVE